MKKIKSSLTTFFLTIYKKVKFSHFKFYLKNENHNIPFYTFFSPKKKKKKKGFLNLPFKYLILTLITISNISIFHPRRRHRPSQSDVIFLKRKNITPSKRVFRILNSPLKTIPFLKNIETKKIKKYLHLNATLSALKRKSHSFGA